MTYKIISKKKYMKQKSEVELSVKRSYRVLIEKGYSSDEAIKWLTPKINRAKVLTDFQEIEREANKERRIY